ncbi:hypothetical protein D3C87_2182620 [compost metagenome]
MIGIPIIPGCNLIIAKNLESTSLRQLADQKSGHWKMKDLPGHLMGMMTSLELQLHP